METIREGANGNGIIVVNRSPVSPASLVGAQDQAETVWDVVATTRWGRYTTQTVEDLLMAACRMLGEPGAALEVGCEGGRWSRMLADRGWRMTCTDIDSRALSVCRRRVPDATCLFVSPDATTLPCDTASVRLLLCLEVFPVMDSDWFAREANRVLTDDGLLVGVTLNRTSLRGLFVRAKDHVHGETRFYRHSYTAWRDRMREAAFDIVMQRGYCWFPFRRASNSVFVPLFVRVERWLGLGRLVSLSPWVAFVARKAGR